MDEFQRGVLGRLPLAEAVLVLFRHTVAPEFCAALFDRYRGTGCEAAVRFSTLVELVTDALIQHGGGGRQSFEQARANGRLKASTRAGYRKLGRIRKELSQAFLAEATQRLCPILPSGISAVLPACLRDMQVVVTDLLDDAIYPGQDLLDAYLQRWTIERVFQQVTEVFGLQYLIGSTPQGSLFQFSLCLLLYNLIQVIRGYVAMLSQREAKTISSELLFRDARDQLKAGTLLLDRTELTRQLDQPHPPAELRQRLEELLRDQWKSAWLKTPAKKKAAYPPPPKQPVAGGHSSAWKLLQAARAPRPASLFTAVASPSRNGQPYSN